MQLHHAGIDIPVFLLRESSHRLQRRERLEAKLGKKTIMMLSVCSKGLISVPYSPVVNVSHILCIAVFVISA